MSPLIIIGLLIALPLFITFVFRINGGVIFFSFFTGSVFVQFFFFYATQLVNSFLPRTNQDFSTSVVQLTLLLLPALLTMLFMRRSMTGTKTLVNIIPSAASGLLTALLVVPLLPPGTRYSLMGSDPWS